MNDQEMEDWLLAEYPSEENLKESARKMEEKFTWDVCAGAFLEIIGQNQ